VKNEKPGAVLMIVRWHFTFFVFSSAAFHLSIAFS